MYGVTIESPIESPMVSPAILNSSGSRVQDRPYQGYLYPPKTNYISRFHWPGTTVWDDIKEGPQVSVPNDDPQPRWKDTFQVKPAEIHVCVAQRSPLGCHHRHLSDDCFVTCICSPVEDQNVVHVLLDKTLLPHCITHFNCCEATWIRFMNERHAGSGRYWRPPLPKCQFPSQRRFPTAWVGGHLIIPSSLACSDRSRSENLGT